MVRICLDTAITVSSSKPVFFAPASDETKEFIDSAEKQGTVCQDTIKYLNPQWTELTQDIVSMFIGDMTSEDVLNAIDERRATQAEAVGDEAWK